MIASSTRREAWDPQGVLRGPDGGGAGFEHRGLQAEELDGRRDGGARLAVQLHLQPAKLKQNPRYPETEITGSGAFKFLEHVKGSTWTGQRFESCYDKERPYLDGYKIFFVKSAAVVPGILGGQFDAEFRGRNPQENAQLLEKAKDKFEVFEGT